ncbi:MAG: hypothetical protein IPH38_20900 [Candidatus Microthrix sp.]|nr:hypothetical protein [Candidatus Microthrix sp.]MBK7021960.1 hypothetical protein [Candidatus Microthrix sp.]
MATVTGTQTICSRRSMVSINFRGGPPAGCFGLEADKRTEVTGLLVESEHTHQP